MLFAIASSADISLFLLCTHHRRRIQLSRTHGASCKKIEMISCEKIEMIDARISGPSMICGHLSVLALRATTAGEFSALAPTDHSERKFLDAIRQGPRAVNAPRASPCSCSAHTTAGYCSDTQKSTQGVGAPTRGVNECRSRQATTPHQAASPPFPAYSLPTS